MNSNELYNKALDYLEGNGVKEDYKKSFNLNMKSAETGHNDAVLAMGWYYLNAFGIEENIAKAKFWYKKSARQGESKAMFSLGQIAYTEHDYSNSIKWFQIAIDNKHNSSIYWLGKLHWHGWGVVKNKKKALILFNQAAKKKVKEANRTLSWFNRK